MDLMNRIVKNCLIALSIVYGIIAFFALLEGGISAIFYALGITTLCLIVMPFNIFLLLCFLPPFWILCAWFLFKKLPN